MYCFGCDIYVPKTNDRRALDSPEAEDVVIVWRAFLGDEEQQISVDIDVDVILKGGDSKRQPKMCRKCFYNYKKYFESHQTLQKKLRKAGEVLELFPCSTLPLLVPASKRPKYSKSLSWPTRDQSSPSDHQFHLEPTVQSPEVEVGVV